MNPWIMLGALLGTSAAGFAVGGLARKKKIDKIKAAFHFPKFSGPEPLADAAPALPMPALAFFVAAAVTGTPLALGSKGWEAMQWGAGQARIMKVGTALELDGVKLTEAQAQKWLFDTLWHAVSLGLDPSSGETGDLLTNEQWLELGKPGWSPRDVVSMAMRWELSDQGPAGRDNALRVRRLIARARQMIATPGCDELDRFMFDTRWGAIFLWTVGSAGVCLAVQAAYAQKLDKVIGDWRKRWGVTAAPEMWGRAASADALRDLAFHLVGFMSNLSDYKRAHVNYAEGLVPGPKLDIGQLLSFGLSLLWSAFTGNYIGMAQSTVGFVESQGGGGGLTDTAKTSLKIAGAFAGVARRRWRR